MMVCFKTKSILSCAMDTGMEELLQNCVWKQVVCPDLLSSESGAHMQAFALAFPQLRATTCSMQSFVIRCLLNYGQFLLHLAGCNVTVCLVVCSNLNSPALLAQQQPCFYSLAVHLCVIDGVLVRSFYELIGSCLSRWCPSILSRLLTSICIYLTWTAYFRYSQMYNIV